MLEGMSEGHGESLIKVQRSGIISSFHRVLQRDMNFTTFLSDCKSYGTVGDRDSNSSSGCVNLIVNERADIGPLMSATTERSRLMHFIPVLQTTYSLFFKKPQPTYSYLVYLNVFSTGMWVVLLISCIVIAGMLCAFSRLMDRPVSLVTGFSIPFGACLSLDVGRGVDQYLVKYNCYKEGSF